VACAAALVLGYGSRAAAGSADDCRAFHRECTDAKAAGFGYAGICHVEQLECRADGDVRVPAPASREVPRDERRDPERADGERSIGP